MAVASRSTLVVHGRLAMREGRLTAARSVRHGLQVMSFEQAAVRLAGGFARPIDDESLRPSRWSWQRLRWASWRASRLFRA